jgi:hypothetical protein
MPYKLSLESEPIVLVEIRGALLDEELLMMTREVTLAMRGHSAQGLRAAVIVDLSEAPHITPRQRRLVGEWRAEVRDLTRQIAVGMAMVVTSQTVRGVLTAISWFQKEPVPVCYVKTLAEALRWAIAKCDAERIEIPPGVRRRLERRSERPGWAQLR